jgi:glycosyltransferase involved in cell wall biosynthesis
MKREPGRKLLYVDNDYHTFCMHREDLVRAAVRNGYEVHVAVPAGTVDAAPGPFELHTYELRRRGLNPLREAITVADLHQLFRRIRPDIVHLLRLKPVMYGGLAARTANVPAVVCSLTGLGYAFTTSGHKGRALRAVAQAVLRVVTRHGNVCLTVENLENKQELVAALIVGEPECHVIRGVGIDAARYQCQPEPAGPLIVLLAARMLWDKGVGEFVDAATLLRSSGVRARFVLVGVPDPGNPASISNAQLEEWNRGETLNGGDGEKIWWRFFRRRTSFVFRRPTARAYRVLSLKQQPAAARLSLPTSRAVATLFTRATTVSSCLRGMQKSCHLQSVAFSTTRHFGSVLGAPAGRESYQTLITNTC